MSYQWFKILKTLFTALRAMLFFMVLILGSLSVNKPVLAIVTSLFFNFRLIAALIVSAVCVLLLIVTFFRYLCKYKENNKTRPNDAKISSQDVDEVAGTCIAFSGATVSAILRTFMLLFWKYGDWPCFKKHRYAMFIFDAIHYGLFMLLSAIFGGIDIGINIKNNNGEFVAAMVLYFMYFILFGCHFALEVFRLLRARRVSSEICDILDCTEPKDINASAVMSDSSRDLTCINITNRKCHETDPEHWIRAHSDSDIFPVPNLLTSGEKILVGFHQTSISSAKSIIRTYMRPSSSGMLGAGIYFATSIDATNGKANDKGGAFIVAKVMLKNIKIVKKFLEQKEIDQIDSEGYDSVYLEYYENGIRSPKNDEYTVKESRFILDYVVYFTKNAVTNYRLENKTSQNEKW